VSCSSVLGWVSLTTALGCLHTAVPLARLSVGRREVYLFPPCCAVAVASGLLLRVPCGADCSWAWIVWGVVLVGLGLLLWCCFGCRCCGGPLWCRCGVAVGCSVRGVFCGYVPLCSGSNCLRCGALIVVVIARDDYSVGGLRSGCLVGSVEFTRARPSCFCVVLSGGIFRVRTRAILIS